jgi:REP element-mobilizing transposase RayT
LALFAKVFRETKQRFVFEIRSLCIAEDELRFYIKPVQGLQLPVIMKWMKQVFAQRYNQAEGREGHIWGDRYRSRILTREPPKMEDTGEEDPRTRVRPQHEESPPNPSLPPLFPLPLVPAPE